MPPCSLRHGQRYLAFEIEMVLPAARAPPARAGAARRESAAAASPRTMCAGGSTHDSAAMASSMVRIAGSGSRSKRARLAALRAAFIVAAATANTGCPAKRTMPSARIGSSCWIGPTSLTPGMSAAVITATTPGAARTAIEIERPDPAVRNRTLAHGSVQRAARLRNVVGIGRFARDVQVRRIVGERRTDDRFVGTKADARGGASIRRVHRGVAALMPAARTRGSRRARRSRSVPDSCQQRWTSAASISRR